MLAVVAKYDCTPFRKKLTIVQLKICQYLSEGGATPFFATNASMGDPELGSITHTLQSMLPKEEQGIQLPRARGFVCHR